MRISIILAYPIYETYSSSINWNNKNDVWYTKREAERAFSFPFSFSVGFNVISWERNGRKIEISLVVFNVGKNET